MVCYSFGFTPLQVSGSIPSVTPQLIYQGLYPAECLAYENRAKGLALQTWIGTLFGLINTFGMPVALPVLTWKSKFTQIYQSLTHSIPHLHGGGYSRRHPHLSLCRRGEFVPACCVFTKRLLMSQTKQLSLEDLTYVFESQNPKKTSFALAKAARQRLKEDKEANGVRAVIA